jgi:hypothetical protein
MSFTAWPSSLNIREGSFVLVWLDLSNTDRSPLLYHTSTAFLHRSVSFQPLYLLIVQLIHPQ